MKPKQLVFPGFEAYEPVWVCCICHQTATLFGQYSPVHNWGVCRECSIKYPYPVELFVPSTRRNKDKEPLMIDPEAPYEVLALRIGLDEMVRCSIDPTRESRPIVKYNITAKELRNPIRRSRMHVYATWHRQAISSLSLPHQMQLPICERCGKVHDRLYELLPGRADYWSHCQRCNDELTVETFWRNRGIFGQDDVESLLDRIYKSHPELFERGVLPDMWFQLMEDQHNGEA